MDGYAIQQNQTAQPLIFLLISSGDHISGLTGAMPTVTISKNGGSFAAPAGAVTEIGNGSYKVAPNATDSNTLGPILLHATVTGADPSDATFMVVAYNPLSAANLGLTSLPSSGTLAVAPTIASTQAFNNTGQTSNVPTIVETYASGEDPATLVWANSERTLTALGFTVSANMTEIAGQTVTATGPVTVPSSIGTSTYAGGAVASVTAPVTVGSNSDKTGYSLGSAGLDAVPLESGINARQGLAVAFDVLAGTILGDGTNTITVSSPGGATRVVATMSGADREATTVTPPA
jgi:hypothetical protein